MSGKVDCLALLDLCHLTMEHFFFSHSLSDLVPSLSCCLRCCSFSLIVDVVDFLGAAFFLLGAAFFLLGAAFFLLGVFPW